MATRKILNYVHGLHYVSIGWWWCGEYRKEALRRWTWRWKENRRTSPSERTQHIWRTEGGSLMWPAGRKQREGGMWGLLTQQKIGQGLEGHVRVFPTVHLENHLGKPSPAFKHRVTWSDLHFGKDHHALPWTTHEQQGGLSWCFSKLNMHKRVTWRAW